MIVEIAGGGEDVIESVVAEIEQFPESALVLDVGGGAKPLRRADYIIDLLPYGKRGSYGFRGNVREHYSPDTWFVADLCSPESWPFRGLIFDYVFCSKTIEDLRDPIRLLQHTQRIGKRGFISTVHWTFEANEIPNSKTRSLLSGRFMNRKSSSCYVGYPHHRWLVNLKDAKLEFVWKSAVLHANPGIRPHVKQKLYHLKWEGSFEALELHFPGDSDSQSAFLKSLQERWK